MNRHTCKSCVNFHTRSPLAFQLNACKRQIDVKTIQSTHRRNDTQVNNCQSNSDKRHSLNVQKWKAACYQTKVQANAKRRNFVANCILSVLALYSCYKLNACILLACTVLLHQPCTGCSVRNCTAVGVDDHVTPARDGLED